MKILHEHPTYDQAQGKPAQTGIQRGRRGWIAVRQGRLIDEYVGVGSKAAAIQVAGTNRVLV